MATAAAARNVKELVFEWEGRDKNGKIVRGEIRSGGEAAVSASLLRDSASPVRAREKIASSPLMVFL